MNHTNLIIEHKFLRKEFFFPTWEIKTLVLGTFNPECGEPTDYFYGRSINNFWRSIERLENLSRFHFQDKLDLKLTYMQEHKFGCTDIIKSLTLTHDMYRNDICGSGYLDSKLFTHKRCKLDYQINEIKKYLTENHVKKVINTWGLRKNPAAFKNHVNDLESFCIDKNIDFIRFCPSPSGRLNSKSHLEALMAFYEQNLISRK